MGHVSRAALSETGERGLWFNSNFNSNSIDSNYIKGLILFNQHSFTKIGAVEPSSQSLTNSHGDHGQHAS